MYAAQTYVPAPVQQSAPILSVDRMNMTAHNLEQTVPLLHEAHTTKDILVGAYQTRQHQVKPHLVLGRLSELGAVARKKARRGVRNSCCMASYLLQYGHVSSQLTLGSIVLVYTAEC